MKTFTFHFDVVDENGVCVVKGKTSWLDAWNEDEARDHQFVFFDNEFPYAQGYRMENLTIEVSPSEERDAFNALLGDIVIDL